MDIRNDYNQLWIAPGDEWKTAFRTWGGPYESLVMQFELINVLSWVQHFINSVLSPFFNRFVIAYLDDILIYSDTLEEHRGHVWRMLDALFKIGLHLKTEKYEFHKQQVKYLILKVRKNEVQMDTDRVVAVND